FHLAMRDVEVYRRKITSHSSKEFRGSGARFQNGDTLLARITPCLENGKTVYVDCLKPNQIGHGSTEFIVLSGIEDKTDNLFIYYLARDPSLRTFAIHSMQGSTGRQRVDANSLRLFEFPLPPIEEQRRIAHILGTLDGKIELNRQMNETLEATARAIFKSWFVDFDPVKTKMEGRKPACMDTETAALFPSAFQDSPLGEIPQGWEVEKIGNLVEIVKGRSYRSRELTESDVALVSIKSIRRGGGYLPDNLRPYTGKYNPEQVITPGELVIAYTDLTQEAEILGKPAIVRGDEKYQTLVPSLHLRIIRPLESTVSVRFLYYLFRERRFQSHVYGYATGTTVLGLSKDGVPSYQFALPPEKIRCLFDSVAKPLFDKIESNENESRTLAHTRDTLLPKLLSGEIRVSETDEILEGI
ncbi:restriction endonuclease subunit S, partial [Candidatus Poribacteria bacterium]|nr:restriction endonuclease subunit S [Candidatus Poribacteria bacterium]